jgi:hypothetical protein
MVVWFVDNGGIVDNKKGLKIPKGVQKNIFASTQIS